MPRCLPTSSRAVWRLKSAKSRSLTVTGNPPTTSTMTSASWAAAMPSATRVIPECSFERVASLTARMVPSISAVSGMMLLVVPAEMRPTVITPGSNTSMRRVTISCSAWTISQAIGIGSRARNGSLAWPPRPLTVMYIRSAEAIIGPGFTATNPVGSTVMMCRANAPVTGDAEPSASGGMSRSPSSSMNRAPW